MTICEISAGSIAVIACGSSTMRIIWDLRSPNAIDASVCPFGKELMPERRISAITTRCRASDP